MTILVLSLCVAVTKGAPEGVADPDNWRQADIVLFGSSEGRGFAHGSAADFKDPTKARAIEGEACTLAWHEFLKKVQIVGGTPPVSPFTGLAEDVITEFVKAREEKNVQPEG